MMLLLDLGNTRLKAALWRAGALTDVVAFAQAEGDFDARFDAWLQRIEGVAAVWLAAVAPDDAIAHAERALGRRGLVAQRARVQAEALGLRVAYAQPQRLGVDRWLAMLAAQQRGDGAVLVASVGSALTIDAIGAQGRHLGGLIAPPPEAMRTALHGRAPRLAVPEGVVARFAASTEDAIESGCVLAAAALIERSYQELAQRATSTPRLILTGGGSEALRAWLPPHELAPQLVLEGLARWASHATP